MELIDKDDVVAEIKRLKMDIGNIFNEYDEGFWEGRATAFDDVICALNTLEVKEVDLEKENFIKKEIGYIKGYREKAIKRLDGLKAQKGE